MLFDTTKSKLKKAYSVINTNIQREVFPRGEAEFISVGTALKTMYKNQDVLKMIQIYVSVYTYYKLELGNIPKTLDYALKKTAGILYGWELENLIALVMLYLTSGRYLPINPTEGLREYRDIISSYLKTVEGIKEYARRYKTEPLKAGTAESPILVDGVRGIHAYIDGLKIPNVEKITFERTDTRYLMDESDKFSYAIDEYTLTNAQDSTVIAKLWFNIYGTENTTVQPACFSDKKLFSAERVVAELFPVVEEEWKNIDKICREAQVPYDQRKLAVSTFAYYYVVWIFGFRGIRVYQTEETEELYVAKFLEYNKGAFEELPYKLVLENEQILPEMIRRVDKRVLKSFQKNNRVFVDDGLSEEYLREFIYDEISITKIQPIVAQKMMDEWLAYGQKADNEYLT